MVFQDNISEEAYSERLLSKLNDYRTTAASKNAGKLITKKLLHSLQEARRTQKMLVGESSVFQPRSDQEPPSPASEQQPDTTAVDKALMADQFDCVSQLNEWSESNETEDEFDLLASFNEVEQKMRDNANKEIIEEEHER